VSVDSDDREGLPWSWKVPALESGDQPAMLYEPGNWGDVLKGSWAVLIVEAQAKAQCRRVLRYLDPYAGSPTYPLTAASAQRLSWLGAGRFLDAQALWLEIGRLASTALLVRAAGAACGLEVRLEVFDSDPQRRAAWCEQPGVRVLEAANGEAVLRAADADMVLVDPYDFLDRWPEILPLAVQAAQGGAVLIYLYNKSPRGSGHARNYKRLRDAIERTAPSGVLIGRVPSDVVLPRAFHEVILLAPPGLAESVRPELLRTTKRLACKLSTTGAFEDAGASPKDRGSTGGPRRQRR
jgi:hypothetical protein